MRRDSRKTDDEGRDGDVEALSYRSLGTKNVRPFLKLKKGYKKTIRSFDPQHQNKPTVGFRAATLFQDKTEQALPWEAQ